MKLVEKYEICPRHGSPSIGVNECIKISKSLTLKLVNVDLKYIRN